jgi:dTDP-4-dehydrorhamnose reductase
LEQQAARGVHNVASSITVVPSLFPKLSILLQKRCTGRLNFVNTGTISPFGIAESVLQQKNLTLGEFDRRTAACHLDTTRLSDICGHVAPVLEALLEVVASRP